MRILTKRILGLASGAVLILAAALVVPGCGKTSATNDTITPPTNQPAPDPDNNDPAAAPGNGVNVGDLPDIDFDIGPGPGSASARR